MQTKSENGIKWISCDSLGELINEFKKYRDSKSANERKNYNFDGWGGFMSMLAFETVKLPNGNFSVSEIINSVRVYQENGTDLSLNLAPLNFREADWNPYHQKIKKILKEIWETGEVKNYQGLDVNWPANSQPNKELFAFRCDQCHKYIGDRKLTYFSDVEKDLDFCSESCHSKFKRNNDRGKENQELKKQLKKEANQKSIWMIVSIVVVSISAFIILFCWLKIKKLKKR